MDGCGTAPARQQGTVDVQAAKTRDVENLAREQRTKRRDDDDIGGKRGQVLDDAALAQRVGREDRQPKLLGTHLDARGLHFVTTTGMRVGTRVDGTDDVVGRCREPVERGQGEGGRTHEDDIHCASTSISGHEPRDELSYWPVAARYSLSALRRAMGSARSMSVTPSKWSISCCMQIPKRSSP